MAKYIEKQAAMDKFAEVVAPSNHSDFQRAPTWNDAVDIIENFPPADVRPVVWGRWVINNGRWCCDKCTCQAAIIRSPFCPNCGADMREEADPDV